MIRNSLKRRNERKLRSASIENERSRYYRGRVTALKAATLAHTSVRVYVCVCGVNRDHMIARGSRVGPIRSTGTMPSPMNKRDRV